MKNLMRVCGVVVAVVCVGAMLSACGFRPMYGTAAVPHGVRSILNDVAVSAIPDRSGQQLRNGLIDRFYAEGRPSDPRYRLDIAPLAESITDLDISKNADTTRAQMRLSTTMNLVDLQTNAVVANQRVNAVTSYNILASQFTTRVSEQDARDSAINDLARQIEQQVVLFLNRVPYERPSAAAVAVPGKHYMVRP